MSSRYSSSSSTLPSWVDIPATIARDFVLTFPTTVTSRSHHIGPRLPRYDIESSSDYFDFGDLEILLLEDPSSQRRLTYRDPWDHQRPPLHATHDHATDYTYAIDDDIDYNPYADYDDAIYINAPGSKCRRPAFARQLHINCNSFHEIDRVTDTVDQQLDYVSEGAYRHVWVSKSNPFSKFVVKTYKWDEVHGSTDGEATYDRETDFEYMRMDAYIGDIFTSNPYFVDTYGYCAASMLSEYMPYGDVESIVDNSERTANLHKMYTDKKLLHMNDLSPDVKLQLALEQAEAVSYLHNHPGGVIVHDDIQLPQFLLTRDPSHGLQTGPQLQKLNDFNRAVIMLWDDEKQQYCRYKNGGGGGDWRAPEEYLDLPLNEKIDVFSLGENILTIVSGLDPFPEEATAKNAARRIQEGEIPDIDDRIKRRSFAERKLAEIARRCFTFNPDERITINELVQLLREAVDENNRRNRMRINTSRSSH